VTAVLLLHGLGGSRAQSLDLLPPDVRATRIAPDLPGHGDADLPADHPVSFAAFAALVADLLDSPRLGGPVPVVGVSMGAGVATTLAATRPDLVERLVLVRPAWLDVSPPPNLAPFGRIADLLRTLGPDAGLDAFRSTPEYLSVVDASPAMADSLLGQFARPHAVARSRVLAELPHDLPLPTREAYGDLRVPTLVLAAPGDPVHPEQLARTLTTWIPDARLTMVPHKGVDPAEHRTAVHREVAAALGSSDPEP